MRVLVADADPALRAFIRKALADEGFIVDIAHDGQMALEMAREGEHDAILIESLIPKLSGQEVLHRLRALGIEIPVILTAEKDDERATLQGLNSGADDCVTKPFRFAELSARIRAILRRTARPDRRARTESVLRAGKLELHLLRRELKCAGKPIHLTKVEFELLEVLMRRRGEVISQNVLKQHLFGSQAVLDTNVLPVHILNLRSKVDGPCGRSAIRTVRGCGYAFDL